MTDGYDKEYMEAGAVCLAEALDYAAGSCQMDLSLFLDMFIASGYAKRFEDDDPAVTLGMSGTELVCRTIEKSGLDLMFPEPVNALGETSLEYWLGYFLAYMEFYSGQSFKNILAAVSLDELAAEIPGLLRKQAEEREALLTGLLEKTERKVRLKEIRKECGFSQRELAERSGINLRTLQQYEVRAKDLNKAAASTLRALAGALGCEITDIME